MRIPSTQLASHLSKSLARFYLLFGSEALLIEEGSDQIRVAAQANGFSEVIRYSVGIDFEWQELRDQSQTLSLFSSQRLIEIRVPSGRLGEGGTAALLDFVAEPTPDTVLLVLMGRLDKRTQSSRWFKAVETAGVLVDARPVSFQQLPQWIERRLRANDILTAREVSARLAYYVEGNLLAASQEVDKLSLLLGPGANLDLKTLEAIVADHARFSVFTLVDACLSGDVARSVRVLGGLRREGTDASLVLWALVREVRSMVTISRHLGEGRSRQTVYRQCGVWSSRGPLVTAALARHRPNFWTGLRARLLLAEQAIKGGTRVVGGPWLELERILLRICGINNLWFKS